jgi:short-subunit dehydrogenase
MGTATNRPFAVVTGASSGIGFELAKQCALNNFDVLMCAEDEGIHQAARHLGATGAVIEPVRADLSTFEGCEKLVEAVNAFARPLDAVLLNAGVGVNGSFVQTELEDELKMIGLNVNAVVHLAKRLVPRMVNRGSGRVLITASVVSTAPAPFLAVYGATKAFDLSVSSSRTPASR